MDDTLKAKICSFCALYIGGPWKDASIDIRSLSGGLSNDIYLCSLPDDITGAEQYPRKAVLRFFGEILRQNVNMLILDNVMASMLSERRIGPKVLGISFEGRIEEYITGRSLLAEEIRDLKLSACIARKMAQFHQFDMPLEKEPRFIFGILDSWRQTIRERKWELPTLPPDSRFPSSLATGTENSNCQNGDSNRRFDLDAESEWIRGRFQALPDVPVVFCHNDLQPGNILMRDTGNDEIDLQLIDFEYCCYNYRAFDLGNHLNEWMYEYQCEEFPHYRCHPHTWPTKEERRAFFEAYVSAGKHSVQSAADRQALIDRLDIECLYGAALSNLLWAVWSITQDKLSKIKFGYYQFAVDRFQCYFEQKSRIVQLESSR